MFAFLEYAAGSQEELGYDFGYFSSAVVKPCFISATHL
jgi:hypothetical protein